eukprot:6138103-Prymnesium_polylepis.3
MPWAERHGSSSATHHCWRCTHDDGVAALRAADRPAELCGTAVRLPTCNIPRAVHGRHVHVVMYTRELEAPAAGERLSRQTQQCSLVSLPCDLSMLVKCGIHSDCASAGLRDAERVERSCHAT